MIIKKGSMVTQIIQRTEESPKPLKEDALILSVVVQVKTVNRTV